MKCAMLLLNVKACLYIRLVLPSSGAVLRIHIMVFFDSMRIKRKVHNQLIYVGLIQASPSYCCKTLQGTRR